MAEFIEFLRQLKVFKLREYKKQVISFFYLFLYLFSSSSSFSFSFAFSEAS